jgi:predicted nucleic acid-binding protein
LLVSVVARTACHHRGGATYDGRIAMTAAAEGATLVTLDRRARRTYALVGARIYHVA